MFQPPSRVSADNHRIGAGSYSPDFGRYCTMRADLSDFGSSISPTRKNTQRTRASEQDVASGNFYYKVPFTVCLSASSTTLKAKVTWKEEVRPVDPYRSSLMLEPSSDLSELYRV